MCVIFLVDQTRPTEEMVRKAWDANDDGGGLAWRETIKGKRVVKWKKGIEDVQEMVELAKTLPTPFIMHFRIASVGGVRPQLTHPFPIEKTAPLSLKGNTEGYVLFHNGDWRGWSEMGKQAAIGSNTPIPTGKWSDTRAMAWLCAIYGIGFMEMLPEQRGIAFGPEDMEIFTGNGWTKVNNVWCSNDYFQTRVRAHRSHGTSSHAATLPAEHYHYCKYRTCTEYAGLDKDGYCAKHPNGKELPKGTTGGSSTVTPFRQGSLISAQEADKLSRKPKGERVLSRGEAKRVRKLWKVVSKGGLKANQAKEDLLQITLKSTLSAGSVH